LSHQLGPRGQEPQAALDRGSKRRESIAQILHKGMSANNNVSGRRMLEAPHGSQSLLEMTMIALQSVIQVSRAPMLDTWQESAQRRRVTPRPVGDDALWCTVYPSDGTYEEAPCRFSVTPLAEVDVHDLAILVNRTIAVGPSAVEAAIRLIHVPLPAYRPSVRAGSLREQW